MELLFRFFSSHELQLRNEILPSLLRSELPPSQKDPISNSIRILARIVKTRDTHGNPYRKFYLRFFHGITYHFVTVVFRAKILPTKLYRRILLPAELYHGGSLPIALYRRELLPTEL